MTARYVLDTNILTALLRHETKSVEHAARAAAANAKILLCPVVFYEVLRGLLHRDAPKQKQHLLDYTAAFMWKNLNGRIGRKLRNCGLLYAVREYK